MSLPPDPRAYMGKSRHESPPPPAPQRAGVTATDGVRPRAMIGVGRSLEELSARLGARGRYEKKVKVLSPSEGTN